MDFPSFIIGFICGAFALGCHVASQSRRIAHLNRRIMQLWDTNMDLEDELEEFEDAERVQRRVSHEATLN